MLTLLLTIIFIWLVFKAVENVAEELGRYIRGFFKWLTHAQNNARKAEYGK